MHEVEHQKQSTKEDIFMNEVSKWLNDKMCGRINDSFGVDNKKIIISDFIFQSRLSSKYFGS